MRLFPRLMLGAALLLPLHGHAQTVTAQSAHALQDAMHAWIAGLVGPGADATRLTPTIVPQDDHYRLTLAIPGLVGDDTASAQLRPLDAGRWSLDALQFPSSMHFNARLPMPGGQPGNTAFSITFGSQHWNAVFDPALKTRSRLQIDLHDLTMRSAGPLQQQTQHIGQDSVTASLQPGKDGKLELDQSSTLIGWTITSKLQDKPAFTFAADRVSATEHIVGLDRHQAGTLLSAVGSLIGTLPSKSAAAGVAPAPNPATRAALRAFVTSLPGLFTSLQAEETFDGLRVSLPGKGQTTIRHARFAIGGSAPQGLLHTWIDLSIAGLTLPHVPAQYAGLVPHHLTLHPSLSGVPAEAVMKLALDAIQPNADQAQLQAQLRSLAATPGITVALEQVGFDIGPAVVQGVGHLTVTGPNQYRAEAHLAATGFNALLTQAHESPALQQAMPALIMLRGLAKPEGDRLVWDVLAEGDTVTVNGIALVKPPAPGHAPHP